MVMNGSVEVNVEQLHGQLDKMVAFVSQAASKKKSAYDVEHKLFQSVLELGRQLFGVFLQSVGDGDLGAKVILEEERTLHRHEQPHRRRLLTVFGEFFLDRCVYSTGNHQPIELIPVDQQLQLPESDVSYLLQEWDQLMNLETAFGKTRDTLETILRIRQSVDTLECGSRQLAGAAEAFFEQQPVVDRAEEGKFLVVTEDNKGIPMVRPQTDPLPAGHRTKGQKKNKKQMACVGCVYSVDPHIRTAEELVTTLFREPDRPQDKPPEAQSKRYRVSLTRDVNGVTVRGQTEVFEFLSSEVNSRRRQRQILIHLSDGQASLETDRLEFLPCDARTIDILDLMHVLPRLWEAAHLFEREGSSGASNFVKQLLLKMLSGGAKSMIADLRRRSTRTKLRGKKRETLDQLTSYLEHNLYRMKYDEYLGAGYPIATGVIEGACRHLVKDRMERSGMRWKIPGAQAMLTLRAIHASGDWEQFLTFRMKHETKRLYPNQLNKIHALT